MSDPISVHKEPTQPQIEAGFRQTVLALASIASALGYAGVAGELNGVLAFAGPAAMIISFVWGQVATRRHARQAATMAEALPNTIAVTK